MRAFDLLLECYPDKGNEQKDIESETKLEIVDSGFFTLEDYLNYRWNPAQARDSVTKGLFSQSLFLCLDEDKKKEISAKVAELFKDLDEIIETDIHTNVYIAKKRYA